MHKDPKALVAAILRGESDIYICLSLPGKSSPKDSFKIV